MKNNVILLTLAGLGLGAAAHADVTLWEDLAPVGGNMGLTSVVDPLDAGNTVGLFDGAVLSQYRNYNNNGQDYSAYANQAWTFTFDVMQDATQFADADSRDDTFYNNVNGVAGGWIGIDAVVLAADTWYTVTWTGVFPADPSTGNGNMMMLVNQEQNAVPEVTGGSFYVDNYTFTVVPEPSTFALLAGTLALGAVMIRRRRS